MNIKSSTAEPSAETRERFKSILNKLPQPGVTLKTKNGQAIILHRNDDPNFSIKFTANAYVDEEATGWYLTDEPNGLRVLILPSLTPTYTEALESGSMRINSIKVVRLGKNGKSILGEING